MYQFAGFFLTGMQALDAAGKLGIVLPEIVGHTSKDVDDTFNLIAMKMHVLQQILSRGSGLE